MQYANKRRGKISITTALINDNPKGVAELFALIGFVSVYSDYNMCIDVIEHHGICNSFRELTEGETIPTYILTCYQEEFLGITGAKVHEVDPNKTMIYRKLTF